MTDYPPLVEGSLLRRIDDGFLLAFHPPIKDAPPGTTEDFAHFYDAEMSPAELDIIRYVAAGEWRDVKAREWANRPDVRDTKKYNAMCSRAAKAERKAELWDSLKGDR